MRAWRRQIAPTLRHRRRTEDPLKGTFANWPSQPLLELQTDAGELKIIPEPAGTRSYDDLRRAANREPLGRGIRLSVASIGDQARMLASLNRERDLESLHTTRRLIELERERSPRPQPRLVTS
jgi:hypothetical protein